jgi:hypothetical protein
LKKIETDKNEIRPVVGLDSKQNKLSHNYLCQDPLTCVFLFVGYPLSCSLIYMHRSLLQEKAYQKEQLRIRTEIGIAQLKEESHRQEVSEIKTLFALLRLAFIVLLYARLYLSYQKPEDDR